MLRGKFQDNYTRLGEQMYTRVQRLLKEKGQTAVVLFFSNNKITPGVKSWYLS